MSEPEDARPDRFPGDLPVVNQLVDLWGLWHTWLPSRVEDGEGDVLVVAAPLIGMAIPPEAGDRISMRWLTRRGVGEAAADLLRVREHPVALWTLEVVGAPMITQRRRYARTAVTLPMQLDVEVEEDEVGPVLGSTVDIGEGGVHCIARGLDEVEIGAPVAVTLEVDGRRVDAQGRVLRMKPLHDGFRSVVVTFDQLDRRDADHIRRFVFASSLRSPVRESV